MVTTSPEMLAALVEGLKKTWRAGAAPDTPAVLAEHPELLCQRSLVIDLAYEEYCLLEEAGAPPEPGEFCCRLPAFRTHLREVLDGHRLLADHPELLDGSPQWPRPGDQVEQLTVVRELGRGAFARVYLALDPEAGNRRVVLKLTPGRSGEARALGPISHPHIASVLWARPSEALFAVCMPFVAVATLRDAVEAAFVAGSNAPSAAAFLGAMVAPELPPTGPVVLNGFESYPDALARVAVRLADGVDYLHRAGLAHGDLKPSNVLLGPGGNPYLIDFNLSTSLSEPQHRCGGTVPYMAPERLRLLLGGQEPVSATAGDVYAFGIVLFEALTGQVPFLPSGDDQPAIAAFLHRRIHAPRFRAAAHPDVPRVLGSLIDACLDLAPDRRPTMAQVRHELGNYLARHRRHLRWAMIAATGALAVAAGVWFAGQQPPPQDGPASRVVGTTTLSGGDRQFAAGLEYLKSGHVSAAMRELDESHNEAPDGRNTAYLAYCQSLAGQDLAAVGLYRQAIRSHKFTPAWVRNNLSRSLLQAGLGLEGLREAEAEAREALALSPGLRPARLNRACARLQLALTRPKTVTPDLNLVAEVEAAMRGPPYTADLYSMAATVTVLFGEGEECQSRAVLYLEGAIGLGRRPGDIAKDPSLRRLAGRPDFKRVLAQIPGKPVGKPSNPYLVPPPLD